MDFHAMKRKELQALCKQHNIPANLTNLEMVNKLSSLLNRNKELDNKKPNTRLRSCLKNVGEPESNSASDGARDSKKVKFSPQNEVVVLDSDLEDEVVEEPRVTRRMSMLRSVAKKGQDFVDNVDKPVKSSAEVVDKPIEEVAVKPVRLTRSTRGSNAVDGVEVSVKLPVAETRKGQDFVNNVDKPVKSSAKVFDKPVEEVAVKPVRLTRSTRGRNAVDGVEVSVKLPVAETRKGQDFVDNADKPVKSSEEVVDKPVRATRSSRGRNAVGGVEVSVKLPVAETRKGQDFVDNVDKPVKSSEEVVDKPIEEVAVKPVRLTRATRGRNAVDGVEVSVKLPVAESRKGQDFVDNVDRPVKSREEVVDKPIEEVAVKPVRLTRATRGRNAVDGVEVSFKLPVAETRKGHNFVDNADKPVKSSEEVVDRPVRATRSSRGRNAVDGNEVSVKLPVVETKKRKVGQRSDCVGLENESGDKPLPIKENPMRATRSRSQRAVDSENSEVLPMVAKRSKKSDNPLPVGDLLHKSDNRRERRKGRGEKMQQNQGLGKAKTGGKSRPKSLQTLQEENASLMKSGGTIHHLAVHQEKTSIPLVSETDEDTLSYGNTENITEVGGEYCTENINAPDRFVCSHEELSASMEEKKNDECESSLEEDKASEKIPALDLSATSLVSATDSGSRDASASLSSRKECSSDKNFQVSLVVNTKMTCPSPKFVEFEYGNGHDEGLGKLFSTPGSNAHPKQGNSYIETEVVPSTKSQECTISEVKNKHLHIDEPQSVVGIQKDEDVKNASDENLGTTCIETEVVSCTKLDYSTLSELKKGNLNIDEPGIVVSLQKDESSLEDVKATENIPAPNLSATALVSETGSGSPDANTYLSTEKECLADPKFQVSLGVNTKMILPSPNFMELEYGNGHDEGLGKLFSTPGSNAHPKQGNSYIETEVVPSTKSQECTISEVKNKHLHIDGPQSVVGIQKDEDVKNASDENLGTTCIETEVVSCTKLDYSTLSELKKGNLNIDEPGIVVGLQKDESSLEDVKATENIPALNLSATALVSETGSGSPDANTYLSTEKECLADPKFQVSLGVNTKMILPSPNFMELEYGNGHDEGLGKLFSTPGSNAQPKQGTPYFKTEVVPSTKTQECTIGEVKNMHLHIDEPGSVVSIQKDEGGKNAGRENVGIPCIDTEVVSFTKLDDSALTEVKNGNLHIDEPGIVVSSQKDEDDKNAGRESVSPMSSRTVSDVGPCGWSDRAFTSVDVSPDTAIDCSPCEDPFVGGDTDNEAGAVVGLQNLEDSNPLEVKNDNLHMNEHGTAVGLQKAEDGKNAGWENASPISGSKVSIAGSGNKFTSLNVSPFEDSFVGGDTGNEVLTKVEESILSEVKNGNLHIDEPGIVVSSQKDEDGKNAARENVGTPCIDTEVVSFTKLDDSTLTEVKNRNLHIDEPGIVVSSQRDEDDKNACWENVSPMSSRTVPDVGPCGWSDSAFTSVDVSPGTAIDCSPCEDPFVGGDTDNEAGAVVGLQKLEDSNPLEVKNDNLHMNEHGTVGLQKDEDGKNAGWGNASPISGSKVSIVGSGNEFTSLNVSPFEDSFVGGDTGNEALTKVEESTLSEVKNGNLHIDETGLPKDEDKNAGWDNVGTPCIETELVSFTKLDDSTLSEVRNGNLHMDETGIVVGLQKDEDDENACWENVSPMSSSKVSDTGNEALTKLEDSALTDVKSGSHHTDEPGVVVGLQKDEDNKDAGCQNVSPDSSRRVSNIGSGGNSGNKVTSAGVRADIANDSSLCEDFAVGNTNNEALTSISWLIESGHLNYVEPAVGEGILQMPTAESDYGFGSLFSTPETKSHPGEDNSLSERTEYSGNDAPQNELVADSDVVAAADIRQCCTPTPLGDSVMMLTSEHKPTEDDKVTVKAKDAEVRISSKHSPAKDDSFIDQNAMKEGTDSLQDHGLNSADSSSRSALLAHDSSIFESPVVSDFICSKKEGFNGSNNLASSSKKSFSEDAMSIICTNRFSILASMVESVERHAPSNLFMRTGSYIQEEAEISPSKPFVEIESVSDKEHPEQKNTETELPLDEDKVQEQSLVPNLSPTDLAPTMISGSLEKGNIEERSRSELLHSKQTSSVSPVRNAEQIFEVSNPQKSPPSGSFEEDDNGDTHDDESNKHPQQGAPYAETAVVPFGKLEEVSLTSEVKKGYLHVDEPHVVVGPEDEDITVIEDTTSDGAASTPGVGNDNEMVLTSEQNSIEDDNGSAQDHGLRTLFATPACGKHFEGEMRSYSRLNPAEDDFLLDHELKLLFASPAGSIHSSSKMFLSEQIATDLQGDNTDPNDDLIFSSGDEPVENAEDILTQVSDSIVNENTALEKFGAVETSAKAERDFEYLADANAPAEIVVEEKELMEEQAPEANHMKPVSSVVAGDNVDPNDDAEEKFSSEEEPVQNSHEDIVTQVSASIVNENSPSGETGAEVQVRDSKSFTEANPVAEIVVEEEKEHCESLIVSNELMEEQAPPESNQMKSTSSVHAGTAFEDDAEKWQPCSELVKLKKTLSVASRLLNTTATMKRREPISSLAQGTPMKMLSYDMKENAPASTKMGDNAGSAQPKSTVKRRPLQDIPNWQG